MHLSTVPMVAALKLMIRMVGMVQQMWALENISFGRALARDLGAEFTVHVRRYAEFTVRVGDSVVQRRRNVLMSVQQWVTL